MPPSNPNFQKPCCVFSPFPDGYLHGEATARFEEEFAAYCGTSYCVGTGNGLDALTLIFLAYRELGVMNAGDEVIVPANTYIATLLSILRAGLKPMLCEPSFETCNIDAAYAETLITPRHACHIARPPVWPFS